MASIAMESRCPIKGPGIYITAGGLCPLFANVETNKGMIGLVDVADHDRIIEVYQWESETSVTQLARYENVSGAYVLNVVPASRQPDLVLYNIPSPARPTIADRFTAFSFIPDLEAMFEQQLNKDFSQIAAQFQFNDGAVSTFSLQPETMGSTDLLMVTYANSRFPNTPTYSGLGFGIQIAFAAGDAATLTPAGGTPIEFDPTGTYYIRIENNCFDGSAMDNDIALLYADPTAGKSGLILLQEGQQPIYPVKYVEHPHPETRDGLCTPGFFGKTLDWPEM